MRTNVILDYKLGWGCWSVNLPKSNKEQVRAANVSLYSDIACGPSLYTVGKIHQ